MSSGWVNVQFDHLVEFPPDIDLEKGAEFPFIEMSDVREGVRFAHSSTAKQYSGSGAKFCRNDILFARITPCLDNRKIAQARIQDKGFGSTEFFVFRSREGVSDQSFVYYLSITDLVVVNAINSYVGASGRQRADSKFLRKIRIDAPPLPIQRKIAAILSAYDDLIENNNKRIALLEKAAEEIYREWFVRLRFPGWETTPFFKGIPEGWEIEAFDKVVSIKPQEAIEKADLKPYVGMDDLSLTTMIFSHSEYRTGSSGAKFRNGDTLFPRITPSLENGKRGYVMNLAEDEVGFGSTEFIVMREKKLTREFIYLLTCTSEFRKHAELSMIGASGRQRVQEDCFSFFLVKVPPKDLLVAFSSVVSPMFSQIKTLHESIKNLVETRDLLLSRLISGKLPVDDLDIQFPPSMMPIEEPDHA